MTCLRSRRQPVIVPPIIQALERSLHRDSSSSPEPASPISRMQHPAPRAGVPHVYDRTIHAPLSDHSTSPPADIGCSRFADHHREGAGTPVAPTAHPRPVARNGSRGCRVTGTAVIDCDAGARPWTVEPLGAPMPRGAKRALGRCRRDIIQQIGATKVAVTQLPQAAAQSEAPRRSARLTLAAPRLLALKPPCP